MKPVVIFAATRWELRALHRAFPSAQATTIAGYRCLVAKVADQTYWLVQTGIGPDAAAVAARKILKGQPVDSAFSAGFACALAPAQIGDVILGLNVTAVRRNGHWVLHSDSAGCDEALRTRMLTAARKAGLPAMVGKIVSAEVVIGSAEEKQGLSQFSGVVGLDMESAALGLAAATEGVPFGVVRTVSDLRDEDLPIDFNLFLKTGGWLKGLQALVAQPGSLSGLNRLRKQSRLAADRLTQFFIHYTRDMSSGNRIIAHT